MHYITFQYHILNLHPLISRSSHLKKHLVLKIGSEKHLESRDNAISIAEATSACLSQLQ